MYILKGLIMINLNDIVLNPKNPRFIKDDKFDKLKKSIKAFPKMMELRPIVVDDSNVILGGNMRFNALKAIGYTEIEESWIKTASKLTEEEKKEFVIKDNSGFGEWDYDQLANEWDSEKLEEWGLDLPWKGTSFNDMADSDVDIEQEFDPVGESAGLQRVVFVFDGPEEAESYLNNLNVDFVKRNMAWQVNLSTQST